MPEIRGSIGKTFSCGGPLAQAEQSAMVFSCRGPDLYPFTSQSKESQAPIGILAFGLLHPARITHARHGGIKRTIADVPSRQLPVSLRQLSPCTSAWSQSCEQFHFCS